LHGSQLLRSAIALIDPATGVLSVIDSMTMSAPAAE
jgi:hypothetical protein